MKHHLRLGFAAALAAVWMVPAIAAAYVDIELDNGRHVVGDSYKDAGAKLVVYRPAGAVELDRANVRSIKELAGRTPSDRQQTIEPSQASEPSSGLATFDLGHASAATGAAATPSQLRAKEITAKLFEVYRFRLAAKNRGDEAEYAKLDKEAERLNKERAELLDKAKSEKPKSD